MRYCLDAGSDFKSDPKMQQHASHLQVLLKNKAMGRKGFEPSTFRLSVERSTKPTPRRSGITLTPGASHADPANLVLDYSEGLPIQMRNKA